MKFFKISRFRIRAFAWHLACSVLAGGLSAAWVFGVWHPVPLAKAVGVGGIFLMMLAIDVVLGPILTFTVAKEGKKPSELKWDLLVIVLIQLSALMYGLHSIAVSRPVYVVFDVWRFEIVQANEVRVDQQAKAQAAYRHLPWGKPEWVAVRPAANSEERNDRMFGQLSTGVSPAMQPQWYAPWYQYWGLMVKESQPVAQLNAFNASDAVQQVLAQYPDADRFLPLKAPRQDMTVLMSTKNQRIIAVVDLRPWQWQ